MSDKCCDCWHVADEGQLTVNNKIEKYYIWIRNPTCECECHTPDTNIKPMREIDIKSDDSPRIIRKKIKKVVE